MHTTSSLSMLTAAQIDLAREDTESVHPIHIIDVEVVD